MDEEQHFFKDLAPGAKFTVCAGQEGYKRYCRGSYLVMCKLPKDDLAVILCGGGILSIDPNLKVQKLSF